MSTIFVERLTSLDFSLLCPTRGLVGETWLVDIELTGALNSESMVLDFGVTKKEIKAAVELYADHVLLVPEYNSTVSLQREAGGRLNVVMALPAGGKIRCTAPAGSIRPLPLTQVTAEGLKPLLEQLLMETLPASVEAVAITLTPQTIDGAWYHYSHGLKKHNGACQRIAHGHRSALRLYVDGRRRPDLEERQCEQWRDIYIATADDLLNSQTLDNHLHHIFAYHAPEGYFELQLPAARCYLLSTDTTVEQIAAHLAAKWGEQFPQNHIKVVAYEGVGKGAVSESCASVAADVQADT